MPKVLVTLPVYNEERDLRPNTERILRALEVTEWDWRVVISDNGSTDGTMGIGLELERKNPRVNYLALPKGRGLALRRAWTTFSADVYAYMDIDLSTDLACLWPLLSAVTSGAADLAIGSRHHPESKVSRGLKREVISRGYNLLVRSLFKTQIRDFQCGFKAISHKAARQLLHQVKDDGFFFDTELLLLAEHAGLRIRQEPVIWTDDPDSRVKVLKTAWEDLKGLARVRWGDPRDTQPGASPQNCSACSRVTRAR